MALSLWYLDGHSGNSREAEHQMTKLKTSKTEPALKISGPNVEIICRTLSNPSKTSLQNQL